MKKERNSSIEMLRILAILRSLSSMQMTTMVKKASRLFMSIL